MGRKGSLQLTPAWHNQLLALETSRIGVLLPSSRPALRQYGLPFPATAEPGLRGVFPLRGVDTEMKAVVAVLLPLQGQSAEECPVFQGGLFRPRTVAK